MKKIYLALVAALMAALIPLQVMAETPQLSASNANGEVKVSITSGTATQSADELLPGVRECKDLATQEFTLKADAGVIASLRLEISEIPTVGKTTPLNNYDIKITDASGNTVYDSSKANESKRNDSYKEMLLGELQANEEKTYNITYKLIDTTVDVSNISFALAAKTNVEPTPKPATPEPTLKPKFDFDSIKDNDEFVFDSADEVNETAATDSSADITEIKKVCGQDIPAGRFSVTGNGNLKISSSTGTVKSESVISENPVSGKSVKTAVVLLEEGDVLTITPIEGEEKARLQFNKVTTEKTTATPTPVNPVKETKTNPKTGDDDMGIIIGVAAFAILAFVLLEVLKRRNKNRN